MEVSELCVDTVKTINLRSRIDTPPSIPCSPVWWSPAFYSRLWPATWFPEALPSSSSAFPLSPTLCHPARSYLSHQEATHSHILAWKIPWRQEPDGLATVYRVTKSRTRLSNINPTKR